MSEKLATTSVTICIPAESAALRLAMRHDRSFNGEIVRALREYTERHIGHVGNMGNMGKGEQ